MSPRKGVLGWEKVGWAEFGVTEIRMAPIMIFPTVESLVYAVSTTLYHAIMNLK